MLDLATPALWIGLGAGLILGLLAGLVAQKFLQSRRDGGRTVAAVQQEMDEYREQVQEHFERTSDLFRNLTESYRDVYEHLSGGARDLCDGSAPAVAMDVATRGLLEGSEAGQESNAARDPESGAEFSQEEGLVAVGPAPVPGDRKAAGEQAA